MYWPDQSLVWTTRQSMGIWGREECILQVVMAACAHNLDWIGFGAIGMLGGKKEGKDNE
jgi:hypothetical protein